MSKITPRKEQKALARRLLHGKLGFLISVTMMMTLLNLITSTMLTDLFSSGSGIWNLILQLGTSAIINIFYYLLYAGQIRIYYKICDQKVFTMRDLLFAFSHQPEQVAIFALIQFILQSTAVNGMIELLLTVLFSDLGIALIALLLLIVVSVLFIWIQLGLSFVLYLYNETPWQSMFQLLKQSWQMMKGHRIRMLILKLSFLGLDLLSLLSFGIGYLFAEPYILATNTLFYWNFRVQTESNECTTEF